MLNGLSTNRRCSGSAICLSQSGIAFAFRYFSKRTQMEEKVVTRAEALALANNNIDLAVVYQDRARQLDDFLPERGTEDATHARTYAQSIGQPAGTAIFFAVDFDAQPADYRRIASYFRTVRAALGGQYLTGVYGSGFICTRLKGDGLVDFCWLAAGSAWRDSATYQDWDIKQSVSTAPLCGLDKGQYEPCVAKKSGKWHFRVAAETRGLSAADADGLPVLRRGDRGAQVGTLQVLLNQWLADHGAAIGVDNDFGAETERAVKAFQSSHVDVTGMPLKADGIVGGITWAALGAHSRGERPAARVTAASPWWHSMPATTFGGSARARAALERAIAEAARGAGESGGNNMGPDVEKYLGGIVGTPNNWCAGFVSWCLKQSGPMPFPYTVGARSILTKAGEAGLQVIKNPASDRPLPGDIIVWWRGTFTGWQGHTGYVHRTEGGRLYTVEGNRSSHVEGFEYSLVSLEQLLGIVRIP